MQVNIIPITGTWHHIISENVEKVRQLYNCSGSVVISIHLECRVITFVLLFYFGARFIHSRHTKKKVAHMIRYSDATST